MMYVEQYPYEHKKRTETIFYSFILVSTAIVFLASFPKTVIELPKRTLEIGPFFF